jgi:quinolinate synthase
MTVKQLQEEILKLKNQKDVLILAHYYQPIEIQEIANYLGDSLGLSRIAKEKANTEYIIFAGVDFMAETASILNQDKHIMIPNYESCCVVLWQHFLLLKWLGNLKNRIPDYQWLCMLILLLQ